LIRVECGSGRFESGFGRGNCEMHTKKRAARMPPQRHISQGSRRSNRRRTCDRQTVQSRSSCNNRIMRVPFKLGVVGHFGLAVRDPKKSARWFQRVLGLRKEFEFENGVAIGNDNVTIALFKGKPSPQTFEHMSFHLPNMSVLRKALAHLKKHKVEIEDPGDEIGPESPGSPHMGLWFHDPDGYRWELSVQGGR
jgi:catechol 2,3-dioxygenase-like lactoylglutathione lyase family enzyme